MLHFLVNSIEAAEFSQTAFFQIKNACHVENLFRRNLTHFGKKKFKTESLLLSSKGRRNV